MANYQCFPCQKLDEATNCEGCVLRDYFTTEEDIVNLKKLCSFGGVVRVRENIERALSLGNSVHEYIARMIRDIDNMRFLQNMRRELRNEIAELRNEVAELRNELRNEVAELRNLRNELRNEVAELRNEVAELRGRVTDDDTHVSNTPDDLDITRMSVSPQGSPDVVESPLAGSDKHDG